MRTIRGSASRRRSRATEACSAGVRASAVSLTAESGHHTLSAARWSAKKRRTSAARSTRPSPSVESMPSTPKRLFSSTCRRPCSFTMCWTTDTKPRPIAGRSRTRGRSSGVSASARSRSRKLAPDATSPRKRSGGGFFGQWRHASQLAMNPSVVGRGLPVSWRRCSRRSNLIVFFGVARSTRTANNSARQATGWRAVRPISHRMSSSVTAQTFSLRVIHSAAVTGSVRQPSSAASWALFSSAERRVQSGRIRVRRSSKASACAARSRTVRAASSLRTPSTSPASARWIRVIVQSPLVLLSLCPQQWSPQWSWWR